MELTKFIEQRFIELKIKQKERKNVNMKNKKMNNKGFSLVELIIVIAIMAVLVGVLAPAYLRYVEKSRKSADIQAIDAVMSAMEATAIDPEFDMTVDKEMEVTFSDAGVMNIDTTNKAYQQEIKDIVGSYTLKSTDWKGKLKSVKGVVDTSGQIKFTIVGSVSEEVFKTGNFPADTVTHKIN